MCKIKYLNKILKKLPPDERKLLVKNVNKLRNKIESCETSFDMIFNNDSIKYDKYENNFYAVRFHGKISMRVLYRFENDTIEVHMVYFKHEYGSDYIRKFREYSFKH